MTNVTRRDATKALAGLAVGAGLIASNDAHGEETKRNLYDNLGAFMFAEEVTFKTDPNNEVLEITPIDTSNNNYDVVSLRTGTVRVFIANYDHDDFTKEGGLYWSCGDQHGKFQLKRREGSRQMVVRDKDGTVHVYLLVGDFRC